MRDRYISNLAGRGLKIGDLVVCTYRVPSALQWWTSPFHVGVIQDVNETPDENSRMVSSETRHCAVNGYVKVSYLPTEYGTQFRGFTQLDSLAHLLPLQWSDGLKYSPYFACSSHSELLAFAAKCGLAEHYSKVA